MGSTERIIASVDVYFWLNIHPDVRDTTIYVPAIESPSDMERFNSVFSALTDATGIPERTIFLNCYDAKDMRAIARGVLEHRLLPRDPPGFVRFDYSIYFGCGTASQIRAVPTKVDLGGGNTVELTMEQRLELLYCGLEAQKEHFMEKLRREAFEQRMSVLEGGTGQI